MKNDKLILITGKYNTAKVIAPDIQDDASDLIQKMMDDKSFQNENIVIMPDIHYSSSCCVGFTKTCQNNVIHPYIIGNDAGCGVICVQFPEEYQKYLNQQFKEFEQSQESIANQNNHIGMSQTLFKKLFEKMDARIKEQQQINMQFKNYKSIQDEDEFIRQIIRFRNLYANCLKQEAINEQMYMQKLKQLYQKLKTKRYTFGTIGTGNHFVEIGYQTLCQNTKNDANKQFYLIVHSGSRALGKSLAEYYTSRSINSQLYNPQAQKLDDQINIHEASTQSPQQNMDYQKLVISLQQNNDITLLYVTETTNENQVFVINFQETVYSYYIQGNMQLLQIFFDKCIVPIVNILENQQKQDSCFPKEIQVISQLYQNIKLLIIAYLKKQNKQRLISQIIQLLREIQRPANYQGILLSSQLKEQYLEDLLIVQQFAHLNRFSIVQQIFNALQIKQEQIENNIQNVQVIESVHNYFNHTDNIMRKGAIKSQENEMLCIPLNMAEGVAVFSGASIQEFNFSAPHGLGRQYKRKDKHIISMEDYKESMNNIFSSCVNTQTLDEAPQMYKQFNKMLPWILKCVSNLKFIIRPIYNLKAFNNSVAAAGSVQYE